MLHWYKPRKSLLLSGKPSNACCLIWGVYGCEKEIEADELDTLDLLYLGRMERERMLEDIGATVRSKEVYR